MDEERERRLMEARRDFSEQNNNDKPRKPRVRVVSPEPVNWDRELKELMWEVRRKQ